MTDDVEIQWRDYAATLAAFNQLADIRFKLLTLVPIASGLAVAVISSNVDAFAAQPVPRMLGGMLGFLVTLGLTFYDQRNSQLYNALFVRAVNLEGASGF